MGRKLAVVALSLLALGVALVMPARADDAILKAHLTGADERPGPGDADATGDAKIYIDDDTNKLCLSLTFAGVDGTLSGLHIHFAPPASPGPVVIPFAVPAASPFFQCVAVPDEALLDNLSVNPQQYYINLHSTPNFAAGAIRGQLHK
jgi:hypothetical protein